MYEICVKFVFPFCMFYNIILNKAFVSFQHSGDFLKKYKLIN